MKKIPIYTFIVIILVGLSVPIFSIHASATNPNESCTGKPPTNEPCTQPYVLLEPLPCDVNANPPIPGCNKDTEKLEAFDPSSNTGEGNTKLGEYLNIIIRLFIGLCAVLAVIMIVIAGIEYSTSELISNKAAAIERIKGAVLGLLLALGAWTILFTINPDLLKTDVDVGDVTLDVNLKDFIIKIQEQIIKPGGPINVKNIKSRGTPCDADAIFKAAQSAGRDLTVVQASALACIGGAESGCKNIPANVPGVESSAYGPFQILGGNRKKFGNTDACRSNPNSLACHATMAAGLFKANIRSPYRDWLITQAPCRNAACIAINDPSVNLHISTPDVYYKGKLVSKGRSDVYNYCGLERL